MRRLLVISCLSVVFACGDNSKGPPDGPRKPACSDLKDNDDDGMIDFPLDPGCESPDSDKEDSTALPACSDHRDNDRDGKTDYPNDPGCPDAVTDNEKDDCPSGPRCPQCSNGRDDDGNGALDFPSLGCDSAGDPIEFVDNPTACGTTLKIKPLPPTLMDNGMLDNTSTSGLISSCGGVVGSPAIAYLMFVTSPTVAVITTIGSVIDTVIDLRGPMCLADSSILACNDNISLAEKSSRLVKALMPGAYYILVKGKTLATTGPYHLEVQLFLGEGEQCTANEQCGPGLVCRVPLGATSRICTEPVCSDGLDDDGDGKTDYPIDPGCAGVNDATEGDDCPNGPLCPDCADGVDNDADNSVDYPADISCKAAGDASEACTTSEPVEVITGPTTMGDNTTAVNDYDPTCNSFGGLSPDLLYRFDLPKLLSLVVNVNGFDTVHSLLDSTCGGAPIRCTDFNPMSVTNLAAGTYYLTVEGYSTGGVGPFTIQTSGVIAPGGSCEGDLFASGALTCPTGVTCTGPVGARTCRTQCSDGVDNNGDGTFDFPNDPSCATALDDSEITVCPGPMCPACADGIDNDIDGDIDYPADGSCQSAAGPDEECITSESIQQIVGPTTAGNTSGAVNDYDPTCNSSFDGLSPDLVYRLDVPELQSLDVNVNGFDTVHSLLDSTCGGAPIQCTDFNPMSVTGLAAGRYYLTVEGYFTTGVGAFTIQTAGVIAAGGSCESPLFTSGALTCPTGVTCSGPVGSRTCRTQCTDGVDNNGNGPFDYPNDPGCASPLDDAETTVCPGMTCPACADGIDNDSDTLIDYPMDPGCTAAGGTTEACAGEQDQIVNVVSGVTMSTLVGAHDDHTVIPGCSFTSVNGVDVMFSLTVPQMATLRLSTQTPSNPNLDTVMSLLPASCSEPSLECNDDAGFFPDYWSLLDLPSVAAGTYIVAIDAFSPFTVLTPFLFNVSGTIALNGSCEGPLVTSGAFTCAAGLVCSGTPGSKTCQ